jgi:hypothetical protein
MSRVYVKVILKLCQLYLLVKGYINSTNLTPNKKTIHEYKPSKGVLSTKEKTTKENLERREGEHPMTTTPTPHGFNPCPKLLFFEYFSLNTTIFGT